MYCQVTGFIFGIVMPILYIMLTNARNTNTTSGDNIVSRVSVASNANIASNLSIVSIVSSDSIVSWVNSAYNIMSIMLVVT